MAVPLFVTFVLYVVKSLLPLGCGSFQEAQVQGTINTDFLLLHAALNEPLGLIRQAVHK
jgi:hypothetical protein